VSRVTQLDALEILDSRGRPTLAVIIGLDDRVLETVSVPSGASIGRAEAKELRDQNKRYRGLGTRRAVANVCGPIAAALLDRDFTDQDSFDRTLIELDATPDKSHFGANAILATSLAFARATAQLGRVELFEYFANLRRKPLDVSGQILGKTIRIAEQLLESKSADIVEWLVAIFAGDLRQSLFDSSL